MLNFGLNCPGHLIMFFTRTQLGMYVVKAQNADEFSYEVKYVDLFTRPILLHINVLWVT